MQCTALFFILTCNLVLAQNVPGSSSQSQLKVVTVPLALDHNRVVINADLSLPDGSTQRIRAWVDNGNPDLCVSRRVGVVLGLSLASADRACTARPSHDSTR